MKRHGKVPRPKLGRIPNTLQSHYYHSYGPPQVPCRTEPRAQPSFRGTSTPPGSIPHSPSTHGSPPKDSRLDSEVHDDSPSVTNVHGYVAPPPPPQSMRVVASPPPQATETDVLNDKDSGPSCKE